MKNIFKRLLCKHEYVTLTNIHGDAINWLNGARSIQLCVDCEKIKYSNTLDKNCNKVNEF